MDDRTIGAYAIWRSDPERPPLLADSQDTLNKVIALRWIGEWSPEPDQDPAAQVVRQAILDERWSDAVVAWMNATSEVLDIFPFALEVHTDAGYPDAEFGPRVQTTPLFRLFRRP